MHFIVNYDYDFVFNETGEESVTRVDSMLVASSELNCQYNLTDINIGYTMPLKMIITFPGIDDLNGYTIERLISVVNGQFNETVSNYLVYFGNNQTLTPIEIAFEVISDGTLILSPSSSIELTSQFRLINARVAWGYFFHQGPVSRDNISKELPNEIFDNPHIANNQLLFSNPQINFNIISNIGMPLFFEFSNVYAVGKNNERVYADFNGSTSYTMPIAQPDVMFQTSSQEFLFDRENGQTNRLFEITPQELHYSWAVSTPDYVATEDIVHYLVEPIDLRMQMEVILPLQLDPTSYFIYSDTLISDISAMIGMDSLSENMRIEVIKLYLDYTNKMPLNCTATARFMDESMEMIHQYEEITIESAKIDSHGAATEASMGEIIIEIADEDISNILKTKEIILDMKFTGYNEDSKILITTEDKVNIHVSLFAKAGIKIELDNK